ncbi:Dr1-associated corepressor [Oryzias melastigma]|uniref:Dr1-associated corepressor n=1 Tax=Oryzias melastigma TaxID=30732 RepID=A0A834C115_ORYME|nr:Dr1-associated corepressor [Oryzias melastigma]
MPGHKRKYNVRFPPRRIKKIMQKDAEVGRIATAVPVIIAIVRQMRTRRMCVFLRVSGRNPGIWLAASPPPPSLPSLRSSRTEPLSF